MGPSKSKEVLNIPPQVQAAADAYKEALAAISQSSDLKEKERLRKKAVAVLERAVQVTNAADTFSDN